MTLGKERREQYSRIVAEGFPDTLEFPKFTKKLSMRYGQNPGTPAAFFAEEGASGPNMASINVLQKGRGLGYINTGDMDLGQSLLKDLHDIYHGKKICVIVKHEIPCGVAIVNDGLGAFNLAWGCDSLSAFGGVHNFNYEVDENLAKLLIEKDRNTEVVYAPSFTRGALEVLAQRESLRVVQMGDINAAAIDYGIDYKRVRGGMLAEVRQETKIKNPSDIQVVSVRQPSESELESAIFLWQVARYVRSNAIVIGTREKTHGIGSGQQSRIDAAHMVVWKANGRPGIKDVPPGYGTIGTVMASDAYMPQTDVVELCAKEGITSIIYPLGSIKDQEVIDTANKYNIGMIATRKPGENDCERAFLHR